MIRFPHPIRRTTCSVIYRIREHLVIYKIFARNARRVTGAAQQRLMTACHARACPARPDAREEEKGRPDYSPPIRPPGDLCRSCVITTVTKR
jgi:hypothetical protein